MLQNYSVFCSQFAPGSSQTFLWHFGSSHSRNYWELCSYWSASFWCSNNVSPFWELPAPTGIYKFQDTPLLLSIQSLSVHEYTSYPVKGNKPIVLNLLYHYLNLLGSNQDKPKKSPQYSTSNKIISDIRLLVTRSFRVRLYSRKI